MFLKGQLTHLLCSGYPRSVGSDPLAILVTLFLDLIGLKIRNQIIAYIAPVTNTLDPLRKRPLNSL
jgi:hypothetical protein